MVFKSKIKKRKLELFLHFDQQSRHTNNYLFNVVFLECFKFVDATPVGLQIRKNAFIEFDSNDMDVFWNQTIASTERDLLETLNLNTRIREHNVSKEER